MTRVVAIDWSGQLGPGQRRKIWLAEARDGELVRLETDRGREDIADRLLDLADEDPELVVGIDFAFSLPSWFLEAERLADVEEVWGWAATVGEARMAAGAFPFWGRPGTRRPELPDHFRRTEHELGSVGGIRPKSVFQIGGAGVVGPGSIRGMPILRRLQRAGFRVWPFDQDSGPRLVEIYPRLFTGPLNKHDLAARQERLTRHRSTVPRRLRELIASVDDAFDSAISALEMASRVDQLRDLSRIDEPEYLREGMIWRPSGVDRTSTNRG